MQTNENNFNAELEALIKKYQPTSFRQSMDKIKLSLLKQAEDHYKEELSSWLNDFYSEFDDRSVIVHKPKTYNEDGEFEAFDYIMEENKSKFELIKTGCDLLDDIDREKRKIRKVFEGIENEYTEKSN